MPEQECLESNFATTTLAYSQLLGIGNHPTLSSFHVICMAEPLCPRSAYSATCKHTSGEIKSVEFADGGDVGIPVLGPDYDADVNDEYRTSFPFSIFREILYHF